MKPATGLVLLLAVVAALYFVSLGLGLALNRDAPRVDLRVVDCNGQPVTGIFKLTEPKAECTLAFGPSDDEYRKGELDLLRTPATGDVAVFVREEYDEDHFKKADRDPSKCFIEPPPVASPAPLAPPTIPLPPEVLQSPLRLQIRYRPNDESDAETWVCWVPHDRSEPYRFTVLAAGASLALECVGCAAGAQRELLLRLK